MIRVANVKDDQQLAAIAAGNVDLNWPTSRAGAWSSHSTSRQRSPRWLPLARLTRFSTLWRIRHFDVTKMRIPPCWMSTYTTDPGASSWPSHSTLEILIHSENH